VKHLLQMIERDDILDQFTGQGLAMFLNALAILTGDEPIAEKDFTRILRKLTIISDVEMDITSLSLVLNALARLGNVDKDCLDLLCEQLASKLDKASPRQLGMILNATGKCRLDRDYPKMMDQLLVQIRKKSSKMDPLTITLIYNAAAKLKLTPEFFEELYKVLKDTMHSMTIAQLAMIAHAWASAHVYNDELYSTLELRFASEMGTIDAHSMALVTYGFAHFRKPFPQGHFEQITELVLAGKFSNRDLLMVANAYARIELCDPLIKKELQKDQNNISFLSPKAKALYFES